MKKILDIMSPVKKLNIPSKTQKTLNNDLFIAMSFL